MTATGATAARTVFTTPSDVEIEFTRVFDAPRRLVWGAFTSAEHLPHWLLGPDGWTMPVCEVDLRTGGTWRYVWRGEDGTEFGTHGEFLEIAPPERLVQTERFGDDCSINTLVLTEQDGRTTMSQRMRFASREARDAAMATGMSDGVSRSYDRLEEYLRTPA